MMKTLGPSNHLQPPSSAESPEKKLREVANLYEKHFLGTLLKAMRSTVQESGFIQSNQAEKIFREQLDQEYVSKWGEKGGIGLQDLIYNQLVEKYGNQLGITQPIDKPKGPIQLDAHDDYRGKPIREKNNEIHYRFDRTNKDSPNHSLLAPWSGQFLNQLALDHEENIINIEHENGLLSQFIYKGPPSYLKEGDGIQSGQSLAALSPEAKGFFWNLKSRL